MHVPPLDYHVNLIHPKGQDVTSVKRSKKFKQKCCHDFYSPRWGMCPRKYPKTKCPYINFEKIWEKFACWKYLEWPSKILYAFDFERVCFRSIPILFWRILSLPNNRQTISHSRARLLQQQGPTRSAGPVVQHYCKLLPLAKPHGAHMHVRREGYRNVGTCYWSRPIQPSVLNSGYPRRRRSFILLYAQNFFFLRKNAHNFCRHT